MNYITVNSITYAYKAKNYLDKQGVRCRIIRTPRALSACGCGYSVVVREDPQAVAEDLKAAGVKVTGVYSDSDVR